jgi:quercetin dioxygenase-like cupin family protein
MRHFCDLENREAKEAMPGIRLHTFWGDRMLVSITDLDPNVVMPVHDHQHEQIGILLSGELELNIDGEARWLKLGEPFVIPGGVAHGARTGEASARVMDVFSPLREDYKY